MTERDRRLALATCVPLFAIAAAALVPPIVHVRPGVEIVSPWRDHSELLVEHAAAALLAIATVAMTTRSRAACTAAFAVGALAVIAAALPWLWMSSLAARGEVGRFTVALALWLGGTLLAAIAIAMARRGGGLTRWWCVLAAYAVVASPYGCPLPAGAVNVFSGGVAFVASDAALLALAVYAIATGRRHDRTASPM